MAKLPYNEETRNELYRDSENAWKISNSIKGLIELKEVLSQKHVSDKQTDEIINSVMLDLENVMKNMKEHQDLLKAEYEKNIDKSGPLK